MQTSKQTHEGDRQARSSELVSALTAIRKMAMDHPCFDADCFERRDIVRLCSQGGDIFDWTMVAIQADDALRANDQALRPARII